MESHQKRPGGNQKIVNYLSKHFRYPKDFRALVYVSQLSQAEAIRCGVEHWRRNRGRCMGSIYWQLNDNWPVASWSSVDYYGRWKALHYAARRTYDDVLLSLDETGGTLRAHVSNETRSAFRGALTLRSVSVDGEELRRFEAEVDVPPFSDSEALRVPAAYLASGRPPREFVVHAVLSSPGIADRTAAHAFVPFKHLSLKDPGLTATLVPGRPDRMIVACARPALFVEIAGFGGDAPLSDNYFHLVPQAPRLVERLRPGTAAAGAAASTAAPPLRSLFDSYAAH